MKKFVTSCCASLPYSESTKHNANAVHDVIALFFLLTAKLQRKMLLAAVVKGGGGVLGCIKSATINKNNSEL
jgi:hypothetical protein